MPLEALILDYGNVLTHPQPTDWCESVASLVGVSTEAFREAYWEHRQRYDAGLPAAEYSRRVLETLGHSPRASEVGVIIDRLVEADENIEGAARLGLQTLHFIGTDAVSRLAQSIRSSSG